jgi:phosphate starvation-inducible PhoH-like protein
MDPYALGLLLGDSCLTGSTTPRLATALERLLPGVSVRHKSGPDYVLNRVTEPGQVITIENPVSGVARQLGLFGTRSGTKFVPEGYLHNSVSVRLGVLQGLLDSDGGPVVQRDRTCRIQYTTTSARLRDDVIFLVQSMGGIAYHRVRPAAGRTPGLADGHPVHHRNDAHIIDIRLPADVQPFRLARKLEKYRAASGGRPMRFIESIEPTGKAVAVCISVAAADSLYVTEDFLLTHNTLNDSFIILDEAQNTSPEQMKMFLTRLGFGAKIVVTGDVTQVDLPGGQQSGLKVVQGILEGLNDIYFCRLNSQDVVRHKLVGEIVDAYGRYDAEQAEQQEAARTNGQRPRGHQKH